MNRSKNLYNSNITTIFFDVGGVLLVDFIDQKLYDLSVKYQANYDELLKARNKYRPLADIGEISDFEFWELALNSVNVKADEEDFNSDQYMVEIDGAMDLAKDAKKEGCKIAILSNDSKQMFKQKSEKYGFDALFDKILVSSSLGVIKPDLKIYKLALEMVDVLPAQSVFIDDREENIAASRQTGMHSILFENVRQVKSELEKLGVIFT